MSIKANCIFGTCRSIDNQKKCEHGKFVYRCPNLNAKTSDIYNDSLTKIQEYEFTNLKQVINPRSDLKFQNDRIRRESKDISNCNERDRITEPYLCRCAYWSSLNKCSKNCLMKAKWDTFGDYFILDYQLPVSDSYNGKVDLVLCNRKNNNIYLTEYKPNREKTPERLLRMIAEIVTYYQSAIPGCKEFMKKYHNIELKDNDISIAIMFHNESPQHKEFKQHINGIDKLISKYNISVFCIFDNENMIKKVN